MRKHNGAAELLRVIHPVPKSTDDQYDAYLHIEKPAAHKARMQFACKILASYAIACPTAADATLSGFRLQVLVDGRRRRLRLNVQIACFCLVPDQTR